jgi:hypothetical protein
VRDRQIHPLDAIQEDAFRTLHPQPHPTVFIFPRVVVRERGGGAHRRLVRQEHARLDEHLKAVADPEDQFAGGLELGQLGGEVMLHLHGEDPPGRHVVAKTESARDAENLEAGQQTRLVQQPIDVLRGRLRPGFLEGVGGLHVAVRAGGSQNQDVGLGHGEDSRE